MGNRGELMTVLCDKQIEEMISIVPFHKNEHRSGTVSYGVSSYGYDVRVGTKFKIYANEGIAQLIFLQALQVCEVSYADKNGKYQDQSGLTLPMVDT